MPHSDGHDDYDELHEVEERLRAARPTLSELELDRLKLRAMAPATERAPSRRPAFRGSLLGSRLVAPVVALLLLGGTAAAGIVVGGVTHHTPNAAVAAYPGPTTSVAGAHKVAKLKVTLKGIHHGCATVLIVRITGSGITHVGTFVSTGKRATKIKTKALHKGSIYSAKTTLTPGKHFVAVKATFDNTHTPRTKSVLRTVRGCTA
jgi:hypothetical protein